MSAVSNGRGNTTTSAGRAAGPAEPANQEISSLVGGILNDVQRLLVQHLDLLHHEVREDFRKTKDAALDISLGGVLAVMGGLLLFPTLIGLLSWAVPAIPWWGWSGILAGALFLSAVVFYYLGKSKFESFNPLPDETAKAVKENIEWIDHKVTSATN